VVNFSKRYPTNRKTLESRKIGRVDNERQGNDQMKTKQGAMGNNAHREEQGDEKRRRTKPPTEKITREVGQ